MCIETHDTHGNAFPTRVYTARGPGIPDRAMGFDVETYAYVVVTYAFEISTRVGKRWASACFLCTNLSSVADADSASNSEF